MPAHWYSGVSETHSPSACQTESSIEAFKPFVRVMLDIVRHDAWPEFELFTAVFFALCCGTRFRTLASLLEACGSQLHGADDVEILVPERVVSLSEPLPAAPQACKVKSIILPEPDAHPATLDLDQGGVFLFQSNVPQPGFDVLVYQRDAFLLAIECKYSQESSGTTLTRDEVSRKQQLSFDALLPWLSGTRTMHPAKQDSRFLTPSLPCSSDCESHRQAIGAGSRAPTTPQSKKQQTRYLANIQNKVFVQLEAPHSSRVCAGVFRVPTLQSVKHITVSYRNLQGAKSYESAHGIVVGRDILEQLFGPTWCRTNLLWNLVRPHTIH